MLTFQDVLNATEWVEKLSDEKIQKQISPWENMLTRMTFSQDVFLVEFDSDWLWRLKLNLNIFHRDFWSFKILFVLLFSFVYIQELFFCFHAPLFKI